MVSPPVHAQSDRTLCVLLHGMGSSDERILAAFTPVLHGLPLLVVAPRAPHEVEARGGWRMWPMPWSEWSAPGFPRADVEAADAPRLYADWVAACAADARARYGASPERCLVLGHSEGATGAHLFAVHHPEAVLAYFAYAGGPYDATLNDASAATRLRGAGVRPTLVHARLDPVNKAEGTDQLSRYLTSHGVAHETHWLDEPRHEVTDEVRALALRFLTRHLRARDRS
jgi:predicted esterase